MKTENRLGVRRNSVLTVRNKKSQVPSFGFVPSSRLNGDIARVWLGACFVQRFFLSFLVISNVGKGLYLPKPTTILTG